jgi:hypothetical protein
MYLAHKRLPLFLLVYAVVSDAQGELREESKQQQNSDDLMRGVEVLGLVVLLADDTAARECHAE